MNSISRNITIFIKYMFLKKKNNTLNIANNYLKNGINSVLITVIEIFGVNVICFLFLIFLSVK